MGSTLDVTAINAVLKNRYSKKKVNTIAFIDRPFLARVSKMEKGGGASWTVAIRNALPQNRSTVFGNAQATATQAAGPSTYNSWVIPWYSDYATANVAGPAIDQAAGDEDAMIEVVTNEIDGAIENLANSAAISCYHNGGGARGQISSTSTVGSATITLANPDDITNFSLNQTVMLSADDGTGGGGTTTGGGGNNIGFIVGIDYDLATLTLSATLGGGNANWSTVFNGAATGYYLFGGGGNGVSGGSDYNAMLKGVLGWLPTTAPGGSDSFFGQNRSKDPTKLAGVRITGNSAPYEETMMKAMSRVNRMGGKPDSVYVNPTDWLGIEQSQQGRVVYNRVTSFDDPEIGFKSITVTGPKGAVEVVSDTYCPSGKAFMVQSDTWSLNSMGSVPKTIDEDGIKMLRVYNADAYETRFVYRANLSCSAPGWNAVITW